jgi:HTH-type transcriptional dual regulator CecR, C-terminal domain
MRFASKQSGTTFPRDELIEALCGLITAFVSQLLASGIGDDWARLVIREQINPTNAFAICTESSVCSSKRSQ